MFEFMSRADQPSCWTFRLDWIFRIIRYLDSIGISSRLKHAAYNEQALLNFLLARYHSNKSPGFKWTYIMRSLVQGANIKDILSEVIATSQYFFFFVRAGRFSTSFLDVFSFLLLENTN